MNKICEKSNYIGSATVCVFQLTFVFPFSLLIVGIELGHFVLFAVVKGMYPSLFFINDQ